MSATDPAGTFGDGTVIDLTWSLDHHGQTVDGYEFDYLGTERDALAWGHSSFNIRSGYKRYYLALIADRMARLLVEAISASRFSFSDVVEGIEVFNEVDLRNWMYLDEALSWSVTAFYWAWTFGICAERLYRGLSGAVPILLPGISSYANDVTHRTWSDKMEFFNYFLEHVSDYSVYVGRPLRHWAAGIDYHWYHRTDGRQRHIGYLLDEVSEIRASLETHHLDDTPISVFESGVALAGDFVPSVVEDGGTATLDPTLFQANEVWRRLGGALASGAATVGWHAWMSRAGEFQLMGLRQDDHAVSDPASEATTRRSWFAYQRLAERLSGVVDGRMVLPARSSRAELDAATADDYLVVFEYTLSLSPDGHRYAYLAFYDPAATIANGAHVVVASETGRLASATLVDTRVNRILSLGGGTTTLPVGLGSFEPDSALTLPTMLRIYKADSPLLILARGRLVWEGVDSFRGG